ncbi:HNH endonuclease [Gordonia phage GTE8]|uniref:HNH nuclease domain-containing protein n=1 Tax=Gordonia phage GTE8 TaxID=1647475 RepID=A0A0K0N676_9CAUD|nr:HNH endonuclease [Gordonia phage GTE8]AKJ72424.1 hypothetical protein GTE8_81 [Gordonia phage GTE8]
MGSVGIVRKMVMHGYVCHGVMVGDESVRCVGVVCAVWPWCVVAVRDRGAHGGVVWLCAPCVASYACSTSCVRGCDSCAVRGCELRLWPWGARRRPPGVSPLPLPPARGPPRTVLERLCESGGKLVYVFCYSLLVKCENCGCIFAGRKRKFCSGQCREAFHNRDWRSKRPPRQREGDYVRGVPRSKQCSSCSKPFSPNSSRQKYCSRECRPRPIKKPVMTKQCPECETVFKTSRDRQTCSNRCAMRRRYREKPQVVAQKVRAWEVANRDSHRIRQAERCDRRRRAIVGSVSTRDWKRALRRAQGRCAYCQCRSTRLTIDHVVPISRGGRHTIGNVIPACPRCNYQKKNKTVMEWRIWKESR